MTNEHLDINFSDSHEIDRVEKFEFEPIKGYPMLNWRGKRPFTSTRYYPAQHKETHREEINGWLNKIFWGDNLQVMSHLLKEYRGQVKLVYLDPPFDSKAEYKKKIQLKGKDITNEQSAFEEKQYTDIWTNDEYLQFMYERLMLIKELISSDGCLYLHCDSQMGSYLRLILDEIFSRSYFTNQITWKRTGAHNDPGRYGTISDTIFFYSKGKDYCWNQPYGKRSQSSIETSFCYVELPNGESYRLKKDESPPKNSRRFQSVTLRSPNLRPNLVYDYKGYKPHRNGWAVSYERMEQYDRENRLIFPTSEDGAIRLKKYLDDSPGVPVQDIWTDIGKIEAISRENLQYPTQKPETLLKRIIQTSSNPGDLVFDCFMGCGTTQAVAMKLGRRFIGADINLGAVQITTKRLLGVAQELGAQQQQGSLAVDGKEPATYYTGFEVYNVNHYDVFRNPVQAKELLLEALEINPIDKGSLFDGEKDGRMWKIMPVNRIATKADLSELISGFDYKAFTKRQQEHPKKPVEHITLVCMGHDSDLKATLQAEVKPYEIDVEVIDILRDRSDLQFKRDSEAEIAIEDGELVIKAFYPLNLLGKLSIQQEAVEDWREMVESIMMDWNYDGAVLEPKTVDIPGKNDLVQGRYPIPDDAGTIRVKITDLLSESLEMEVPHG